MKANYKEEQKEARMASRKARHGKVIVCANCFRDGVTGPLLKVDKQYMHKSCDMYLPRI